jgi:hypothetical protein
MLRQVLSLYRNQAREMNTINFSPKVQLLTNDLIPVVTSPMVYDPRTN